MTSRPALWVFSDIRFPSPRANGIQVVKTAHALATRGREVRLVVRHSDPRPTEAILPEFGVEATPRLHVDRLMVGHTPNSSFIPRLRYLTQSLLVARRASKLGALVLTRDLQLADLLLRIGCSNLSYEAHAVEAVMYDERDRLYGLSTAPNPTKRRRIENRERRVWYGTDEVGHTAAGPVGNRRIEPITNPADAKFSQPRAMSEQFMLDDEQQPEGNAAEGDRTK